jgi:hypothetical protein
MCKHGDGPGMELVWVLGELEHEAKHHLVKALARFQA